jgi:hypothetical protein
VPGGYQPPAGYQGAGYQPPTGGQAPGQTPGGFRFEMPTDRPRNFNDVMPSGGFSDMFTVTWLPTELTVAYWIWLIS